VRPGMTAEVDIITDERTNVLLIPNQAIRAENGKTVVYKINAAQVSEPVEVKVGISSDTHTELLEGDLKEGDSIVLNPAAGAAAARMQRMFMGGGEPPPEEQGNNPQGQGGNTP
ncbi:MAG: efflux RND transporter periplasmic adaptor subunit, partial [Anaerolineaceae bacterium]